jgi:adenylate kinase
LSPVAAVIVVLGRQGAGKGVQCQRLVDRIGGEHVSTGDLIRSAIRQDSAPGHRAAPFVANGELVPDDVVGGLVADHLAAARVNDRPVVLDGYPRTLAQAEQLCGPDGASIDLALHLAIPRHVALDRLRTRVVCTACALPGVARRCERCGAPTAPRDDDRPSALERRLDLFDAETRPLLDWFSRRGILTSLDGTGTPDQVAARVSDAVFARQAAQAHTLAG